MMMVVQRLTWENQVNRRVIRLGDKTQREMKMEKEKQRQRREREGVLRWRATNDRQALREAQAWLGDQLTNQRWSPKTRHSHFY